VLFAAHFTELADGQFLTALAWGITALRDACSIAGLFTKANPGYYLASALLWSALLSCYQLLIGMA